ncbi:MAG TPA: DoxX family protein [Thermoanaerobaculia bacterium]|jgi:uncharacterized membrane protein YphA (DoxX/SURF4 family)|nr:DoxX family protein [Thermoanaerobaculia bacterium]
MQPSAPAAPVSKPISKKVLWTSYILSALPVLVLLFSGSMKFTHSPDLAKGFDHLGWPLSLAVPLGILEITCAILYAIPRTSVLGAILVAAYMGGAVATHVRIGEPPYVQILIGVLVWGGLYLRDSRLRALLPLRS